MCCLLHAHQGGELVHVYLMQKMPGGVVLSVDNRV